VRALCAVGQTGQTPCAEHRHVLWEVEFGDRITAGEFCQELLGDVVGAGFFRTARSVDDGDFHTMMEYIPSGIF